MYAAAGYPRSTQRPTSPRTVATQSHPRGRNARPTAAYRQRGLRSGLKVEDFNAPERWHEARDRGDLRFVVQPARPGFVHAVTSDEIRDRIAALPSRFTRDLSVVQLSAMTRKRQLFPCYGMQWGWAVYLYPIEDSYVETYHRPPHARAAH